MGKSNLWFTLWGDVLWGWICLLMLVAVVDIPQAHRNLLMLWRLANTWGIGWCEVAESVETIPTLVGKRADSVFHYNIHLKSIDACQTWKTPSIFRRDFSTQISHCLHVSHVFSYLASECRVCLQPYSVAHSSSKEWYVATKESLH